MNNEHFVQLMPEKECPSDDETQSLGEESSSDDEFTETIENELDDLEKAKAGLDILVEAIGEVIGIGHSLPQLSRQSKNTWSGIWRTSTNLLGRCVSALHTLSKSE